MSDIELVIKMPEEMYKWVNDVNKFFDDYGTSDFIDLIKNGKILPKGHGRLVDEKDLSLMTVHLIDGVFVCDAETVIEADTESVKEPCDDYDVSYCEQRDCVECGYAER